MFDNYEKQITILKMKKVIEDAKTAVGVSDLGDFDTDVAALEAAFAADPATVTAINLIALRDKISGLKFERTDALSALWNEVQAEAVAEAAA